MGIELVEGGLTNFGGKFIEPEVFEDLSGEENEEFTKQFDAPVKRKIADVISHFDSVPSLLYLAYVQKGMGIEEGKEFVKDKLARSFQKLSTESKQHFQYKFEKVMEVLN